MPSVPYSSTTSRVATLLTIVSMVPVLVIYAWLISAGTWTQWAGHWYAYDQLATAFGHGQLALLTKPDAALLALSNPYDPIARQNVPFLRDYSLYQGRYYLYFGPVPALILVLAKAITGASIGDQYITFASVAGIFIVLSLLIIRIRSIFFPGSAPWTLMPTLVTIGLMAPWPWLLTTPSIYTAALAAGQFFFLAGILLAWEALRHAPVSRVRLLAAGLLFAGAFGSRISLIVPGCFVAGVIALSLFLRSRRPSTPRSTSLQAGVCFATPLVLALAALAWYNWARFGSFMEAGFMYQLGGIFKWKHIGQFVWPGYVGQNFYNYFLNPPIVKYTFPYIFPQQGVRQSLLAALPIPEIYHSQEITGLIFTAPFLMLALAPILSITRKAVPVGEDTTELFMGLVITLLGCFVIGCAFFFAFFWAAERYLADFLPGLVLLSMIGMWQIDGYLDSMPRRRAVYWISLTAIMAACIVLSLLLAISFNTDGFRQLNPLLWRQLSNLFRP